MAHDGTPEIRSHTALLDTGLIWGISGHWEHSLGTVGEVVFILEWSEIWDHLNVLVIASPTGLLFCYLHVWVQGVSGRLCCGLNVFRDRLAMVTVIYGLNHYMYITLTTIIHGFPVLRVVKLWTMSCKQRPLISDILATKTYIVGNMKDVLQLSTGWYLGHIGDSWGIIRRPNCLTKFAIDHSDWQL